MRKMRRASHQPMLLLVTRLKKFQNPLLPFESARKILFLQMRRITRHLKNDRVHIRQERQIFQLKALDRQVTANFMQRPQFGKNPLDESVHLRSEEHTSEIQSLMRNSYAVLCLKKNK